ncbi:sugar transporter, partial [Flavobacterium sp. LBUM151]
MKKIYVLTLFFILSISLTGNAQDLLKSKDLSTIQVDYLSNDDLAKISSQLKSNNTTIDQVEPMALSKGMSQSEFNKLRIKLAQFEKNKPRNIDSDESKTKAKDKNSDSGRQQEQIKNVKI